MNLQNFFKTKKDTKTIKKCTKFNKKQPGDLSIFHKSTKIYMNTAGMLEGRGKSWYYYS